MYGFLLLRVPPNEALQKTLAGLGVRLLGPHDNHQKARVPVGSLEAVAGLADVEWLGVSLRGAKAELGADRVRGPQAKETVVDDATGIPIVINLFEGDGDGSFRGQLEAVGAVVGEYDPALHFYRAVATGPTIDKIIALDFVLFVELIRPTSPGHDQSTPLIDADLIRPGGTFLQRFGGASSTLGILDTASWCGGHLDLNKNGCGANFTTDAAGVWNDQNGHGTHVLATIAGTGTADSRYRGVATGVGSTNRIRAAKIWTSAGTGNSAWTESAMDYMSNAEECDASGPAPLVMNMSGGAAGTNQTGTDSTSRKLDDKVWTNRQAYVVCSGNNGPGAGTIWSPGVAKNALTVGNVLDNGHLTVGDIANSSSRGPTGDARMKPNVVAPGSTVTSARAGTTNLYRDLSGCSMATPHVSGLVATLMEHYPEFRGNPALLRAHLMASAIAHDDVTGMSNDYGLGRVSGYLGHWAQFDANGWSSHWSWGTVSSTNWQFRDITVPAGTQRLVVVLTWDEPMASAGATRAVTWDVDLWVDYLADCNEPTKGGCGEYSSTSIPDNVEYIVVNNPPAGTYRLKASNWRAPDFPLPYGMVATIIQGDPTPIMTASLTSPASVVAGSTFAVTATVSNPSYIASGVQVALTSVPSGVTLVRRPDDARGRRHHELSRCWRRPDTRQRRRRPEPISDLVVQGEHDRSEVVHGTGVVGERGHGHPDDVDPDRGRHARPGGNRGRAQSPRPHPSAGNHLPDLGHRAELRDRGGRGVDDPLLPLAGRGEERGRHPADRHPGRAGAGRCGNQSGARHGDDSRDHAAQHLLAARLRRRPQCRGREQRGQQLQRRLLGNGDRDAARPGGDHGEHDARVACPDAGDHVLGDRHDAELRSGVGTVDDPLLPVSGRREECGRHAVDRKPGGAGSDDVRDQYGHGDGDHPRDHTAQHLLPARLCRRSEHRDREQRGQQLQPRCLGDGDGDAARPDRANGGDDAGRTRPGAGDDVLGDGQDLNAGTVASGPSTTRYYLSLDGTKNAGDILLTGTRGVPGLAAGASHSGTVTVTIPAATPLNNYVLLACADDLSTVAETNEGNNCLAASGSATVTVTRPDLLEDTVTSPPPTKARGTTFSVTGTTRNAGTVASGASTTRYYLSVDAVKNAGDTLLVGSRAVPGLAAGAATSPATITVTIPSTTPPNTYLLLACADDLNTVVETTETNNCKASATGVNVTP